MSRLIPSLLFALAACNSTENTGETGIIDTDAPVTPQITAVDPAPRSNENHPILSGTAEAHVDVTIYGDAECTTALGTANTGVFDTFTVEISVADDSINTLYADATDEAGNTSRCSTEAFIYIEDSALPATPTLLALSPASPANANLPEVSGTADPASQVVLYADAACTAALDEVTVGRAGTWALRAWVTDDTTTDFYAAATDEVGNSSGCSREHLTYVEDSTAPAAPVIDAFAPVSPSSDPAPTATGTAEPLARLGFYSDESCSALLEEVSADAEGAFSAVLTVGENQSTEIYARAEDIAGNRSTCLAVTTYTHDDLPPAAPRLTRTLPTSPSPEDQPILFGTAEAGARVTLYGDDCLTPAFSATADRTGAFSAVINAATSATWRADAQDAAGNRSACSDPIGYADSGDFEALTLLWVRPDDAPVAVGVGETLALDLKVGAPAGAVLTTTWSVVEGGGTLSDVAAEDPVFTAPAAPGLTLLRVEVSDGTDTVRAERLVSVEPAMGTWWTAAEDLSDVDPYRLDLAVGALGMPYLMTYAGELGDSALDGLEVRDALGRSIGESPLATVYYIGDASALGMDADEDGQIWVAFAASESLPIPEERATVMRWNGTEWSLEGEFEDIPEVRSLAIALDGEVPWVAIQSHDSVQVFARPNDTWEARGDVMIVDHESQTPHELRLAVRDEVAVVAWMEDNVLLDEGGMAWQLAYGATAWAQLGTLDQSLYGVSDVLIGDRNGAFVSVLDESAPLRTPKVYTWEAGRWLDYGHLYAYATTEIRVGGQVRMTADADGNLYTAVGNSIFRAGSDHVWERVGGAPFGSIDFFSYQMSDLAVIDQGDTRLLLVAYSKEIGDFGLAALAAIRLPIE